VAQARGSVSSPCLCSCVGQREGALRAESGEHASEPLVARVLHAHLHSHRNDKWAGEREDVDDTGDQPDLLDRVI